jgi:peptide/nickel transport system substrate-binding protein
VTSNDRTRAKWTSATLLAVLVLVTAACGSSDGDGNEPQGSDTIPSEITVPEPAEPTTGGTLAFGLGAETSDGWDPTTSRWAGSGTIVSRAVYDRLAEYDVNHVAQPFLAESITPNGDFTVWTVKVREGITFHDGTALDAAAVKLNLDQQKASILTGAALQVMGAVEVVDQYTVQVTMNTPWATFPSSMTTQAGVVAAPSQLQASGEQRSGRPVGTGPFVFETWRQDADLTVSKNPDYWMKDSAGRSLPYLDGIDFKILADVQSRGAALESGSVEVMETFDPAQMIEYRQKAVDGQYQMYSNQNREEAVQLIYLNTAKPPFDDPLARQIVAYGTDRETIAQTQYLGLFPATTSLFPQSSAFYSDNGYPSFDRQRALDLNEQYREKYGRPLAFALNLPSTPEFKAIGELAQQEAAQYGVDITLNLVDQSTLIANAALGNFEATGLITFGDPNIDSIFFSGDTVKPIGEVSLNFSRLSDPELTGYLIDARETPDVEQQAAAWASAEARIAQNLNAIFVVRNGVALVYDTNVFGFLDASFPDGELIEATPTPFTAWAFKT